MDIKGIKTVQNGLDGVKNCSEIVLKPYNYVASLPSKNIREKLGSCFNYWLQVQDYKFKAICHIVTTLHNASLIIDDIQDGSDLRRGFPSTHKVYGVPFAINAGNYAYFTALKEVLKLNSFKAVEIFNNQMIQLHEGQGMEIYWRDIDIKNPPTEDHYEKIVVKKSSGLFQMMVELLKLETPEEERSFEKLVSLLGIFFQMRDDYQNICSVEYEDTKGYCEDITEGKFSYPIIHAINYADGVTKSKILDILNLRTTDISLKKEIVEMLQKTGSLEYTKNKLIQLRLEIKIEIGILGGNIMLEELLDNILNF